MTKIPRKKYNPCWAVIRENPAHVLAVFEDLEMADAYAEKCNQEYDSKKVPLHATVQPSDYCHF